MLALQCFVRTYIEIVQIVYKFYEITLSNKHERAGGKYIFTYIASICVYLLILCMIIITLKFGINQSHFTLLSMLVYIYVYTCIHIQSLTLIFGHLLKRNNLYNIGPKLDFTFYDKLEGLVD